MKLGTSGRTLERGRVDSAVEVFFFFFFRIIFFRFKKACVFLFFSGVFWFEWLCWWMVLVSV